MPLKPPLNNYGFTLLEVILVLVFITIFAAVAVVRQTPTDVTLKAGSERLKAHIRYAQMRAMNTSTFWGIQYEGTTKTYWLFQKDDPDATPTPRVLPGESQTIVDDLAQKNISVSPAGFTLSFDGWGRPSTTFGFSGGTARLTLANGGDSANITIIEHTGYVE